MDAEIQFGELEEERPREMRRPDENRHFAVTPCGAPRAGELRVYVDLDAMLDMETHAQSNTNVELGGVMLGGQYVDAQGEPFVVVSDCLRADHFEATKGSFKFTHDTWSDISRRLEEYPSELRMVGWYHTHPDWGVFLSGMDLFICENFFNKPLDLALVIDPCRDDRGWFQWTSTARRGPLRMGGFYLTSSRFRGDELQHVARALEGSTDMPVATRTSTQTSGGYGAPVVNVIQDRSSQWTQVAVLGSLGLQTVLVALLAWAVIGSGGKQASEEVAQKLQEERIQLQAQRDILGEIAARMTEGDGDLLPTLEKSESDRKSLETSLLVTTREVNASAATIENLRKDNKAWADSHKKVASARDAAHADVVKLKDHIKQLTSTAPKASDKGLSTFAIDWKSPWLWTGVAVTVALAIFGVVLLRLPRDRDQGPHDDSKESPADTNTN